MREVNTFALRAGLDDEAHEEALDETGFWGKRGAGCLVLCSSTKRFLLGCRSKDVVEPLTWGTFGGAIDTKENPQAAALRELREETGAPGRPELYPLLVFKSGDFAFHNFLAVVPKEFKPRIDWETSRTEWCNWGDFPNPQHFGLIALLRDRKSLKIIRSHLK